MQSDYFADHSDQVLRMGPMRLAHLVLLPTVIGANDIKFTLTNVIKGDAEIQLKQTSQNVSQISFPSRHRHPPPSIGLPLQTPDCSMVLFLVFSINLLFGLDRAVD